MILPDMVLVFRDLYFGFCQGCLALLGCFVLSAGVFAYNSVTYMQAA